MKHLLWLLLVACPFTFAWADALPEHLEREHVALEQEGRALRDLHTSLQERQVRVREIRGPIEMFRERAFLWRYTMDDRQYRSRHREHIQRQQRFQEQLRMHRQAMAEAAPAPGPQGDQRPGEALSPPPVEIDESDELADLPPSQRLERLLERSPRDEAELQDLRSQWRAQYERAMQAQRALGNLPSVEAVDAYRAEVARSEALAQRVHRLDERVNRQREEISSLQRQAQHNRQQDIVAQIISEFPHGHGAGPEPRYVSSIQLDVEGGVVTAQLDSEGARRLLGFEFRNVGSPVINPTGSGDNSGGYREFSFQFHDAHAPKFILSDNAKLSGRDSHDNMVTVMMFFPRRVRPWLEPSNDEWVVHLGNGETAVFDPATKEVKGGVFREAPIDLNPDRTARHFARVAYQGNGLVLETSRRGESPEYTATQVFNRNENITHVKLRHRGRECLVRKDLVWEGSHGQQGVQFKYASDQEFLDRVVNPECGWQLTLPAISP